MIMNDENLIKLFNQLLKFYDVKVQKQNRRRKKAVESGRMRERDIGDINIATPCLYSSYRYSNEL